MSGFLGSGKTTFLNQYMNKIFEESNQVALIVNEFGRFDVDSHIMNQTALSVSMLQGCICCDLQDDLVMQLHQLSKQEVQHVVIEATGIANPIELLSACQDPIISNVYEAPLVITIVDSKRLLQNENTEATETLMDDQIRASHRLILNKIDLLNSDEARQEVIQYVSQLAPYSQIDLAIYGEVKESVKHGQATIDKVNLSTSHPHTHYEVLSYDFTHPISHEQLVQFILNMPDSILRMKGYVQFREFPNEIYLLQYSGGLPALESMGDMKLPTTVVLIGEKLDKPALKNKLELLQFG
ncbi:MULTISPECIES: CobW family GTP-binding protein [unclassified Staphylococcus]|uniref:CobW family GTP-binding protein n=1 Tax=unclassified Staphylococcus TaxID=91994 RepID=UPI0021D35EA1|nr:MULTISPECIES: CobW family GTP-binding protein [unclassified Staphylococcus]